MKLKLVLLSVSIFVSLQCEAFIPWVEERPLFEAELESLELPMGGVEPQHSSLVMKQRLGSSTPTSFTLCESYASAESSQQQCVDFWINRPKEPIRCHAVLFTAQEIENSQDKLQRTLLVFDHRVEGATACDQIDTHYWQIILNESDGTLIKSWKGIPVPVENEAIPLNFATE